MNTDTSIPVSLIKQDALWLLLAFALILFLFLLLFLLFQRKRGDRRELEEIASARSDEMAERQSLMIAILQASTLLVDSNTDSFGSTMLQSMALVGRKIDAARVYIFRNNNSEENGLHFDQIYKWVHEDFRFPGVNADPALTIYRSGLPRWEEMLNAGECINGPVYMLPDEEQEIFNARSVRSVLIIPIFLEFELWGLVAFEDCHSVRSYSESEVNILRSWGLLILGTIRRVNAALHMQAVADNYKGIVWSVDRNGIVTTFRGQYTRQLQPTASMLEGSMLAEAHRDKLHLSIIERVEKTLTDGPQEWTTEINGKVLYSSTLPLRDDKGEIVGVVGSTDDVTGEARLKKDLEAEKTALEEIVNKLT